MKEHYRPKQEKRSLDKHATPWHKEVAERGTILLTEVGSGLHGTSVSDQDDRDEMGVCIEPPDAVIGFKSFEQYEWKTAWEREGMRANRSGPGDVDLVVYSLRKWMRLAMNGNPTVLLMLFAPSNKIVRQSVEGIELRRMMPQYILSQLAGQRFIGYLHKQRENLLSHNGKGRDCTRPELIEKYGFDTKFAGHMIRLGIQGLELLNTGKITLPMTSADAYLIKAIRTGNYKMDECLAMAEILEEDLVTLMASGKSPLRPEPAYEEIDKWLAAIYQWRWTTDAINQEE
jgi:hypothetical protein